jgi:hypothetical protein
MRRSHLLGVLLLLLAGVAPGTVRAVGTIPVSGAPADIAVNPVTDTVFVRYASPGLEDVLTIVDGAKHATQDVPLPGAAAEMVVDPIRNRVYVRLDGQSVVVAVDVADLALQPIAVAGAFMHVDPGADRLFLVDGGVIRAVDGATLTVESHTVAGFESWMQVTPLGVDPLDHALVIGRWTADGFRFEKIGSTPLQAIETSPEWPVYPPFAGGAVDPYADRLFYTAPAYSIYATFAWGGGSPLESGIDGLYDQPFVDLSRGGVWLGYDDAFGGSGAFGLTGTLGGTGVGLSMTTPGGQITALAIQPATRRIYAGEVAGESFDTWLRAASLDVSGVLPSPATGERAFGLIAVNPATNEIYTLPSSPWPDPPAEALLEIDEPVMAAVPMTTAITPGTVSAGAVTVGFSATSAWTPVDHPIRQIYYQVDSTDGRWVSASPGGAVASITLSGLAAGSHTIYAIATDGQEATLARGQTILTGPIASASLEIPQPAACANGLDDDGDGFVDFPADPGCKTAASGLESPQCDDGADNDADGGVDWDGSPADVQCAGKPWRNSERADAACGLGAELALALVGLARLRRRAPRVASNPSN